MFSFQIRANSDLNYHNGCLQLYGGLLLSLSLPLATFNGGFLGSVLAFYHLLGQKEWRPQKNTGRWVPQPLT